MKYSAIHKQLIVSPDALERASFSFLYAIKKVRMMANLPLTKYKQEGMLSDADHAQRAIITAANELGIDLGSMWGNEIDVSNIG